MSEYVLGRTCSSCGNDDATLCLDCVEGGGLAADVDTATNGIRALLRLMGEDPDRPGLVNTPQRVVRAYLEMASRPNDPEHDLAVVFADVEHPGTPVTVGPIPFVSLCEHHLLPFTGTAWVAYVPRARRVVGLSKLPRTVAHYAGRPQVQERLTAQIADALVQYVNPLGCAVLVQGEHSCMRLRGAKTEGAMETFDLRGIMRDDPRHYMAFLDRARRP